MKIHIPWWLYKFWPLLMWLLTGCCVLLSMLDPLLTIPATYCMVKVYMINDCRSKYFN